MRLARLVRLRSEGCQVDNMDRMARLRAVVSGEATPVVESRPKSEKMMALDKMGKSLLTTTDVYKQRHRANKARRMSYDS